MHQHERRGDRDGLRVEIDILLNKFIDGRPHLARATNISRRGLLLHRMFEPANDHAVVGLQFQLPESDRVITCAARIVRKDPALDAHGIAFTHMAPEHQQLIDAFVESHLD